MSDQPTCETKLLPCPFCGGEAEMQSDLQYDMETWDYWITCPAQWCSLDVSTSLFPSEDGAAHAWNTRNGQLQTDIGARKES